MYQYATRLLQDAPGPSLRVWGEHAKALLAAVTALRLVRPEQQWIAVPANPVANPMDAEGRVCADPPRHTHTPGRDVAVDAESHPIPCLPLRQKRQARDDSGDSVERGARAWAPAHPNIRQLDDLRKEYTLAMAHLLLSRPFPDLQDTGTERVTQHKGGPCRHRLLARLPAPLWSELPLSLPFPSFPGAEFQRCTWTRSTL